MSTVAYTPTVNVKMTIIVPPAYSIHPTQLRVPSAATNTHGISRVPGVIELHAHVSHFRVEDVPRLVIHAGV